MRKLVYVGFSFQHHKNTHAGFNRIVDYMHYDYMISTQRYHDACMKQPSNPLERVFRFVIWKICGTPVIPFYLLKCIYLGLTHNNLTFHFVHGENDYYNISYLMLPHNKVVCTFHQPVDWFNNKVWIRRLKSIDKITVLSDKEIDDFKTITGKNNVVYLPHGISADFYKPNLDIIKEHLLVTVGNWLRDYSFADKVYQQLLSYDNELKIIVVSNKDNFSKLTKHERLEMKSGISDDELKSIYLRSSVLFLPLIRYTANNSLLEASACGCNIVISSDARDNSYIPTDMISLCPMDIEKTVMTIKKANSLSYNLKLSNYIQNNYSWNIVAQKMEAELDVI